MMKGEVEGKGKGKEKEKKLSFYDISLLTEELNRGLVGLKRKGREVASGVGGGGGGGGGGKGVGVSGLGKEEKLQLRKLKLFDGLRFYVLFSDVSNLVTGKHKDWMEKVSIFSPFISYVTSSFGGKGKREEGEGRESRVASRV